MNTEMREKGYLKIVIPIGIRTAKERKRRVRQSLADLLLCATCYQPRQLEADDGQTALFRCKNPMCIAMKME